ncbi:MAG: hypothetical protein PSV36_10315 [Algoriphagus sp.]|nr:hypothetical protein [Algoriphagus sp.]
MSRFLFPVVFIALAIIIAGINRGFDFSDEGLYSFLADPHQANEGGIFNYDLFFKLFYQLSGFEFGIIGIRFLRLFSYFAGAWALAVFWKNTCSEKVISLEVYLLALLGLFAGYAFLPPGISYNSISVVLACFWLAIISKKENHWIDSLILGFILGLLFYVKITSCLILGSLTLGISVYKGEFNWKLIPGLIIPFLAMEFIFLLFLKETGVIRILDGLELIGFRKDYGYGLLFKYLIVGVFWLILVFIPFWVAGYFSQKSRSKARLFLFPGLIILVLIFTSTYITDEWNHGVLLVTVAVLGYVLGKKGFSNLSPSQRLSGILLIGMPFFLFFGSNVYWLRLGIHYWVFWIFGLMILVSGFPPIVQNRLKAGIAIVSLALVINGIWMSPFGQEPLWNASQAWDYGAGKNILLSQKQVDLLKDLKVKTDKYSNDQVIAVYRIPGILYLLDKNSPKSPGYWSRGHLNSYFPDGVSADLFIYSPSDSLPAGEWDTFKKQQYAMPNGEEIQVLWK